ncbi:DUF2459 domain-containing protein [uncultured Methylobacterium sp.]|uniref:DUF2459 domain-containing protein n=1 Tax=uncultured Methylobacterium sp. TaxID=157278 RepID=UPI0035CAAC52
MILRRLAQALAGLVVALVLAVVLTARPGDPVLYPPTEADPQTIHVVSHGWHSGIVLPLAALTGDGAGPALRGVAVRFRAYPAIEFGWGEARFYAATPTLADFDPRLALAALFTPGGSDGVVQVVGLDANLRARFPQAEIVVVPVSSAGLRKLVARLEASFALDAGRPVDVGPGLYGPSLFYRGAGRFSWTNVCNHWTAGLVNAAGLPVAPVLATLPRGLILDLAWRSGVTALP